MTDDTRATRDIVTHFHNAFKAHRPEDLDDLIAADCVLENRAPAPDGARYEGQKACLSFWKDIAASALLPSRMRKSGAAVIAGSFADNSDGAKATRRACAASTSCASALGGSSRA